MILTTGAGNRIALPKPGAMAPVAVQLHRMRGARWSNSKRVSEHHTCTLYRMWLITP